MICKGKKFDLGSGRCVTNHQAYQTLLRIAPKTRRCPIEGSKRKGLRLGGKCVDVRWELNRSEMIGLYQRLRKEKRLRRR